MLQDFLTTKPASVSSTSTILITMIKYEIFNYTIEIICKYKVSFHNPKELHCKCFLITTSSLTHIFPSQKFPSLYSLIIIVLIVWGEEPGRMQMRSKKIGLMNLWEFLYYINFYFMKCFMVNNFRCLMLLFHIYDIIICAD